MAAIASENVGTNEDNTKEIINEVGSPIKEDILNDTHEFISDDNEDISNSTKETDVEEDVWGEDSSYSWSDNECTINDVVFEINSDDTTVNINSCSTEKDGNLILPNKIKVEDKYYFVTSIGNGAFYNCSKLSDVVIPNSVTAIGYCAFLNCSNLNNITIPDSITSIEMRVFSNCSKLSSITIPDGITSIGYSTFFNCSNLSNITIPNSVTSIDSLAFFGCKSLSSIVIPKSVETIRGHAFVNCTNLKEMKILGDIISIESGSFDVTNTEIKFIVSSDISKNALIECGISDNNIIM